MSVQGRVFPESFKREAVDRVADSGLTAGAVARELGVHGPDDKPTKRESSWAMDRTNLERHVAGFLLGHTAKEGASVTSIYDRHSHVPEKRAALEHWAGHLEQLALT